MYSDETNWVLKEALNFKSLQNGGSFSNVLARKMDSVLVPLLAKLIVLVDYNCNLNLIQGAENMPTTQLWLAIFRNTQIMNFSELEVPEGQVPGMRKQTQDDFECKLPFSWLIKEAIDNQWDSAVKLAQGKIKLTAAYQGIKLVVKYSCLLKAWK